MSDGTASYGPTETGPVAVAAAAVVAFGNMVLIHAQDGLTGPPPTINRVDYRFKNLGPIEITSEVVGPAPSAQLLRRQPPRGRKGG